MKRAKFIVLEGLDGSGKSTQVRLLQQQLEKSGREHRFIHFPMLNGGVYGTLIAEFLRGEFGSIEEVHPKLVALLFANDRLEHVARIREWLDRGCFVLADRYVYSNIAFQCAKLPTEEGRQRLKEWILDYEFVHNALPRPDRTLFLNMPFGFIERSLSDRHTEAGRDYLNGKDDIHEQSVSFQRCVLDMYLKLLQEEDGLEEVDCTGTGGEAADAEEINRRICQMLAL